MTLPRPCLDCGEPTTASRCPSCTDARGRTPDTRRGRNRPSRPHAWRRLSKRVRRVVRACEVCGTTEDLTTDHVVPLANGGPMLPDPAGVAVLCRSCNSRKGTR